MHVLIVDGFGEQPESRARFETFRAMIVKAFEDAWPLPRHYEVRSFRELGDFLYESADGMVRVDTIRRFDKLDFIFLDGDLQLRPWSASARQALALLLMCATTGKCVYATGWTAALALCAINIKGVVDHVPRLVHSHPEGGSAADLPRLAPPLDDRMFLDASTGDCYEYDFARRAWELRFNAGLRRRKSRPSGERKLGRFSCSNARVAEVRAPAPMPHETLAAVVSTMQTHFLFEGVTAFRPMLFRPASVKWTLSEKAVSLKVSALMDGLEGTEMFEYGHIIAFQCVSFDPAKYLATTTLINNYVRTKTRLLQKMEKLDFRSQLVHRVGEGTAREVIAKSMGAGRERRASTARPATSSAALSGLGALAAPERAAPERARRASASSRVSEAWGSLQDEVLVEEDYGEDEEEEGSGGAGAPGAGGSAPRHGRVLSGSGASLQRAVAEAAQRQLAFFSRAPAVLHHPQRKVTHRRPWSYSGAGQVPAPAPAALGAAPRAGGAGAGAPWSARSLLETAAEAGGAEAGGTTRGASAAAPGGVATGAETGRGAGGADRQALKLMGGTVEDRVARRILEAQPSKTTTRLAAGLLAGTAERAASANRVEGRFLSRDSAANRGRIPSASVANRIARDVELSCGGGSVGREERSRVSEALEYRLAREARAEAIGASDARAGDGDSEGSRDSEEDERWPPRRRAPAPFPDFGGASPPAAHAFPLPAVLARSQRAAAAAVPAAHRAGDATARSDASSAARPEPRPAAANAVQLAPTQSHPQGSSMHLWQNPAPFQPPAGHRGPRPQHSRPFSAPVRR